MFFLHISNRTENLLRHLAEVIRVGARRSLFEKEVLLIQSQGMERMISQAMSREFGSWCNFEFLLPFEFLASVAERLGMQITPDSYERRALTWRLDHLLRDLDGEVYRDLKGYIQGDNAALKRFQLGFRLANIFDQYQMMRPEMLTAWDAGRQVTDHPAEAWQSALWTRLAAGAEGVPHRGVLLRRVIETLRVRDDLAGILPVRISVFGLHIMPPLFLEYLQGLSRHCDVHLHLLSPCRQYWGDIEDERRRIRRRLARQGQGLQPEPEIDDRHPLLASLGKQGRDFQEMLLNNVEFFSEDDDWEEPCQSNVPTILQHLQSDLLNDTVSEDTLQPLEADDSLLVVSCHSRLREIEVLKDHLLRLLHRDPDLELRDIVVMAPDIHEYAALIPAVFNDIQHTIADRTLRGRNAAIHVFLAFLELFDGRFGWTEVFDLLKNEEVYRNFGLAAADLDILEGWVVGSGIRWGLSATRRREMGLPDMVENTWEFGLDRLLMGYAVDGDGIVDGILPLTDIEGAQAASLGGLCAFVALCERAVDDFGRERPLAEWSALLCAYADELFGEPADEGLLQLRELLLQPAERFAVFHDAPVELGVIRAWLAQSVQERRSGSGFLRGSLTFCSMLPMRSIPFPVVCLLGLNDTEFPRTDSWATFDLMAPPRNRPGDRSARSDDRYQFLEALLAARRTLYLSYIGRSITTNEKLPPSVVVAELLEYLRTAYGLAPERIVVEHPLQPFSARYFSGAERGLFSYNAVCCATAARFRENEEPPAAWWTQELAEQVPEQIQLRDLFVFYADPQRFFLRDCLGIRLVEQAELPDDREPFTVGGLDAYLVEQELIAERLAGRAADDLLIRFRAAGRWPLGTSGELAFSRKYREMEEFVHGIDRQDIGERVADLAVDVRIGEYRLRGMLANVYRNGVLLARPASLKGKDLLSGWIHHLVLGLFPEHPHRTVVLAKDRTVSFAGSPNPVPGLARLLDLFVAGCRKPCPLLIEPAFAYVLQLNAPRASVDPLVKARTCLQDRLEKGYSPDWALLYRRKDPDDILDDRFRQLCEEIVDPIWRAADAH